MMMGGNNDAIPRLVSAAALTRSFTLDPAQALRVDKLKQAGGISRRSFLGGLIGSGVAIAASRVLPGVATEQMLWVPEHQGVIMPAVIIEAEAKKQATVHLAGEIDLVVRYLGKLNSGTPAWEPNGTSIHAFYPEVLEDHEWFTRLLAKANQAATWGDWGYSTNAS